MVGMIWTRHLLFPLLALDDAPREVLRVLDGLAEAVATETEVVEKVAVVREEAEALDNQLRDLVHTADVRVALPEQTWEEAEALN